MAWGLCLRRISYPTPRNVTDRLREPKAHATTAKTTSKPVWRRTHFCHPPTAHRSTFIEIKALLVFSLWRQIASKGCGGEIGRKTVIIFRVSRSQFLLPRLVLWMSKRLSDCVSLFEGPFCCMSTCSAWNWIRFTCRRALLVLFPVFCSSSPFLIYVNESISFSFVPGITDSHTPFQMTFYMSFHNFYASRADIKGRHDEPSGGEKRNHHDIISHSSRASSCCAFTTMMFGHLKLFSRLSWTAANGMRNELFSPSLLMIFHVFHFVGRCGLFTDMTSDGWCAANEKLLS